MNTRNAVTPAGAVQRVIDFRINVWQLVLALIAILGFGIQSYNKQEKLIDAVTAQTAEIVQLKQEVKSVTLTQTSMSSSISFLQFRMENAESEIRSLKTPTPPQRKP